MVLLLFVPEQIYNDLTSASQNKSNYDAYELISASYKLVKLDNVIYLDWNIFQIGRSKKMYFARFEV